MKKAFLILVMAFAIGSGIKFSSAELRAFISHAERKGG
jgi:hypothetical protein